ncbi:maltokinase N-terminal cap-like domain-containing protein [Rhodococcoides trifolii]|nr:phosphotransferase [Rhodococcus trifolii]
MSLEPDDRLDTALTSWIPQQRWFGSKGKPVSAVRTIMRETVVEYEDLRVDHLLVSVEFDDHEPEIYQVPLGIRESVSDDLLPWVVSSDGPVVYDGMRDPDVISVYADQFATGTAPREGRRPAGTTGDVRFRTMDGSVIEAGMKGRVLGAEQSNTSVILGNTLLLKIFRRVNLGINPDVELHRALGEANCEFVASLRGWMEADVDGTETTLAMAQDFAAGSSEGWTTALESVKAALDAHDVTVSDFASESDELGAAVAAVHADLASSLGKSDDSSPAGTVAAILNRVEEASAVVPQLVSFLPRIRALIERAKSADTFSVQRIHGDLHLGQVLRTQPRWLLIDFEGEPAKSFDERRIPDSPLRDVAGMLRSFDYAARNLLVDSSDAAREEVAREWVNRNVAAFCDGYSRVAGVDPRDAADLLRAYELDKAVYEAVYEARNRPTWLSIPMHAIERLVG